MRIIVGGALLAFAVFLAKFAAHDPDPYQQFALVMAAIIIALVGLAVIFK